MQEYNNVRVKLDTASNFDTEGKGLKLTAAMCEKKGMNDRNNRKKVGYSAG
jgi:hypothetical protein